MGPAPRATDARCPRRARGARGSAAPHAAHVHPSA